MSSYRFVEQIDDHLRADLRRDRGQSDPVLHTVGILDAGIGRELHEASPQQLNAACTDYIPVMLI